MQNVLWYVFKHVLYNHLMTRVNFSFIRVVKIWPFSQYKLAESRRIEAYGLVNVYK